jgi:hypothetical protein
MSVSAVSSAVPLANGQGRKRPGKTGRLRGRTVRTARLLESTVALLDAPEEARQVDAPRSGARKREREGDSEVSRVADSRTAMEVSITCLLLVRLGMQTVKQFLVVYVVCSPHAL